MNVRGRAASFLLLATLFLLVACYVTGLTGPATVTIGQSATYDVAFATDSAGTNGTAYVFIDVPAGWTVTSATYDGTVNGSAVSGNATSGVTQSGTPCVAVPAPATGYQRLGFSATFPTVTANDSGTLHVTFTIGGSTGNYTLSSFGGGSFGGPTQQCNSGQPSTLPVTVNAAAAVPPTVTKAFAPATIVPGGTSRLTVTITNPNGAQALTNVGFTDTYPAGLANASTPNLATTCGGTPSSTASSLALANGSIAAGASCTVAIDVTAATPGTYTNTIAAGGVTSSAGASTAPASSTLTVAARTATTDVPTLGQAALMLMAALLGLLALRVLR